ncbi:hypothetical protein DFH29DRAFT_880428 [Suillus ampliporus]|nr:hypothetical protein DFH29DRAFT_880428 [Suillus ampliporus]
MQRPISLYPRCLLIWLGSLLLQLPAVGEGRLIPHLTKTDTFAPTFLASWPPHYWNQSGLTVSIYFTSNSNSAGIPRKDSAAGPEKKHEIICLVRGNGSNSVIVIVNDGMGVRLEDFAAARLQLFRSTMTLLSDAWFLFAIGSLGMIQNLSSAGASRSAAALGFHLERRDEVHDDKVFQALQAAETHQRGFGLSLIPVFFLGAPFSLRVDENAWVHAKEAEYAERDALERAQQSVISSPTASRNKVPTARSYPLGGVSDYCDHSHLDHALGQKWDVLYIAHCNFTAFRFYAIPIPSTT